MTRGGRSTKRALVALLFVTLLVVQPATAAGNYPSAEDACKSSGDGKRLVAIFPGAGNDSVVTGSVTVYPGTTFRVALCDGSDLKHTHGNGWQVESTPGLVSLNGTSETETVRVTDAKSEFEIGAEGKTDVQGISVTVRTVPTAESELADGTIRFETEDNKSEFLTAEEEYRAALDDYENATNRVNQQAEALNSSDGDVGNVSNVTASVLGSLNSTSADVDARSKALESRLYETAWRTDDEETAVAALSKAREYEAKADDDAKAAMKNYLSSLESAERRAQSTARFNLGVGLVVGLLAGVLVGWVLTEKRLDALRWDQETNRNVSTGPAVLTRVVVLALVVAVLTLGATFALGGFDTFGGLL